MLIPNIQRFGEVTSVETEETAAVQDNKQAKEPGFTQEQVNAIVTKESAKATESLLKSLGFEGEGKAKEQVTAFKSWLDSQKTEAEKLQDDLKSALEEKQQLSERIKRTSAENICLKQGVNPDSIDDVITLAGAADESDMESAITKVLQRHPSFKTGGTGTPPASPAVPENSTYEQQLIEARKAGDTLKAAMVISEATAKGIYLR